MAKPKVERYAEELGIVKPTLSQFDALISECIFSERDRYIMRRYILDDVPVGDFLINEVCEKFPYAPLDENGMRKAIKRCIKRLSWYV